MSALGKEQAVFFKPKIMIADQDPRVLNGLGEQVARMGETRCVWGRARWQST